MPKDRSALRKLFRRKKRRATADTSSASRRAEDSAQNTTFSRSNSEQEIDDPSNDAKCSRTNSRGLSRTSSRALSRTSSRTSSIRGFFGLKDDSDPDHTPRRTNVSHEVPPSLAKLEGPSSTVYRLNFIPCNDLLLVSCSNSFDYFFNHDSVGHGFPVNVFTESFDLSGENNVHICPDIVASIDYRSGKIFTWKHTSNQLISALKLPLTYAFRYYFCVKVTDEKLIVMNAVGHCFVIEHHLGADLRIDRNFNIKTSGRYVLDVAVHGNLLAFCTATSFSILDISSSFEELWSFRRSSNEFKSVALGTNRIFMGRTNGDLVVYGKTHFRCDFVMNPKVGSVNTILLLTDEIIACVGSNGCMSFVSSSSHTVLCCLKLSESELTSAVVMGNGRIAVGGEGGFCATFFPPSQFLDAVHDCSAGLYPTSVVGRRLYPLRASWLLVQQKTLSIFDACRNLGAMENGPSSLDEWAFGHNLLMEAVNNRILPASRDFEGNQSYWLRVLYKHCPKLAMGEHDISLVVSMFREAEEVGVIGEADVIVHSIETRRHTAENIVKGKRFVGNAMWELFLHQAEQDARLQELLKWKKVQQLTGLVNALLACVPFCGALVTNAIAASATVLNDINLHDLVDALLGVSKDTGGGLIADELVSRFVKRSNVLLNEQEWEGIPARLRKYVETAAADLNMSVDELRHQLFEMANCDLLTDTQGVLAASDMVKDIEESDDVITKTKTSDVREVLPSLEEDGSCHDSGGFAEDGTMFVSDSDSDTSAREQLRVELKKELRVEMKDQMRKECAMIQRYIRNILKDQLREELKREFRQDLEKMREEYAESEKSLKKLRKDLLGEMRKIREEKERPWFNNVFEVIQAHPQDMTPDFRLFLLICISCAVVAWFFA